MKGPYEGPLCLNNDQGLHSQAHLKYISMVGRLTGYFKLTSPVRALERSRWCGGPSSPAVSTVQASELLVPRRPPGIECPTLHMEIAVIGWGSLIWCPGSLRIKTKWRSEGPDLPIEFARISSDGRLTLVIHRLAGTAPLLAISELETLTEARENLSSVSC